MAKGKGRRKVWVLAILSVLVVVAIIYREPLITIVKLAVNLKQKGVFDKVEDRKYEASTRANLTAIYKGMKLFHESEGQFPKSDKWMDSIKNRIQTGDMSEDEAAKKLIDPGLKGKARAFGYAMNDAASEKYDGDLKDKKMPLIFMSSDTSRNAHGEPAKLEPNPPRPGGNFAVTVDGSIVKLGK